MHLRWWYLKRECGIAMTRALCEVFKVYHHYATSEKTAEKANLEISESKKRVKLNASRRESGIGYSSRKIHQLNPHFLQLRSSSSFQKRLSLQKMWKKDKVDQQLVGRYLRFIEAHRWWPSQGHVQGQICLASLTMTRAEFSLANKFCRKIFPNQQHQKKTETGRPVGPMNHRHHQCHFLH